MISLNLHMRLLTKGHKASLLSSKTNALLQGLSLTSALTQIHTQHTDPLLHYHIEWSLKGQSRKPFSWTRTCVNMAPYKHWIFMFTLNPYTFINICSQANSKCNVYLGGRQKIMFSWFQGHWPCSPSLGREDCNSCADRRVWPAGTVRTNMLTL